MEDLCDLLFELSSTERMDILMSLRDENLRLSTISQKLDVTVTETSRHLQRLSDVQLIQRENDGRYSLTKYGSLAIFLLKDLKFIAKNRQYFLDHDVTNLPVQFVNRLGELVDSEYEIDAVKAIDRVTHILDNAEECIWSHSYHILPAHVTILEKKVEKEVDFRGIYPMDYKLSSIIANRLRFVDKIELRLLVTEKEAMCGFLSSSGQPDYSTFFSRDPVFINLCRDIHRYYWGKASKRNQD